MSIENKVKLILKIGLVILFIGALVFAFMPQKVKVDMFTVEKGDLLVTIEGEGQTRIHDIYTVSAPIDGRITRIDSNPGDIVVAGQTIIANMYPANSRFLDKRSETQAKADVDGAQAALALANAKVRQVQAQLAYELSEFKRTEELYKTNAISKAGIERAELSLTTLRTELETAISNKNVMISRLAAAQANLVQPSQESEKPNQDCQICIHSPVDGRVLRILHKSEGIIPVGTPLVDVGDPSNLEVKIEMLSTNAVRIKVGDEAYIKRWGGAQDIAARVKIIEPSGFTKISALGVEEQRVNVILSFIDPIEKWQTLGDAYRVEASIVVDRASNVKLIPLSALFRQDEKWSVFRVVDGKVELQIVSVGRRNDRYAEIIDGLNVGDTVITHPSNSVDAGVKVEQR